MYNAETRWFKVATNNAKIRSDVALYCFTHGIRYNIADDGIQPIAVFYNATERQNADILNLIGVRRK